MKSLKVFLSFIMMCVLIVPAFAGGNPNPTFSVSPYTGSYEDILGKEIGRNRGSNGTQWTSQRTLCTKDGVWGFWGVVGNRGSDDYTVLPGFGTAGYNGGSYDINRKGHVCGYAYFGNSNSNDAVIWRDGQVVSLGIKSGIATQAFCINDLDEAAGYGQEFVSGGGIRNSAYYWDQYGVGYNLNDCLSPEVARDWYLTSSYGINDSGEVFGSGMYKGSQTLFRAQRAAVAAVPEPGSCALLLSALPVGLALLRRRR